MLSLRLRTVVDELKVLLAVLQHLTKLEDSVETAELGVVHKRTLVDRVRPADAEAGHDRDIFRRVFVAGLQGPDGVLRLEHVVHVPLVELEQRDLEEPVLDELLGAQAHLGCK